MIPTVYNTIVDAIRNKRIITATYRGRVREVCPHAIGTKGIDGRWSVMCYQFAGDSSSGLGPVGSADNWRCMALNELSNVSSAEGDWHTADSHSRPNTCIDRVAEEVDH